MLYLPVDGVGEIMDYTTALKPGEGYGNHHQLFRHVNVVQGMMPFRVECRPALNYGQGGLILHGSTRLGSCLNRCWATPII